MYVWYMSIYLSPDFITPLSSDDKSPYHSISMHRLSIVMEKEKELHLHVIHHQRLSIIIEEDEDVLEEEVIGFPSKLFLNSDNSLRELQIGKLPYLLLKREAEKANINSCMLLTPESCFKICNRQGKIWTSWGFPLPRTSSFAGEVSVSVSGWIFTWLHCCYNIFT